MHPIAHNNAGPTNNTFSSTMDNPEGFLEQGGVISMQIPLLNHPQNPMDNKILRKTTNYTTPKLSTRSTTLFLSTLSALLLYFSPSARSLVTFTKQSWSLNVFGQRRANWRTSSCRRLLRVLRLRQTFSSFGAGSTIALKIALKTVDGSLYRIYTTGGWSLVIVFLGDASVS